MSHVLRHRKQLLGRVNRLIGQLEALKRTIETAEDDGDCRSIMLQLSSIRGALGGLQLLFLEEHLRHHVARGATVKGRLEAADELLAALRSHGLSP